MSPSHYPETLEFSGLPGNVMDAGRSDTQTESPMKTSAVFSTSHLLLAAMACIVSPVGHAEGAFFADEVSQCKAWNPAPRAGEKIRWEGPCVNGYAEGVGKLSYLQSDGKSSASSGMWVAGKPMGRIEEFNSNGILFSIFYPDYNPGIADFYIKSFGGPEAFRVDYYEKGVLTGVYRQNLTDNQERAAYTVSGKDEIGARRNAVFLARGNSQTWSVSPSKQEREKERAYSGYVVVTGSPGNWKTFSCWQYDNCVEVFGQKLAEAGYADWPQARMDRVDAVWQARRQEIEAQWVAQARAREEEKVLAAAHKKLLGQAASAEKLFTYASQKEQERRYDFALDAYRAIVERFPKSKLMDSAVARMGAVQDKIDAQRVAAAAPQQPTAGATGTQADMLRAQTDAQRLEFDKQRYAEQMEQQKAQQEAAERRMREQNVAAYNSCKAELDRCQTDCATRATTSVITSAIAAGDRKNVNLGALQQQNYAAQAACNSCSAIKSRCEAIRP